MNKKIFAVAMAALMMCCSFAVAIDSGYNAEDTEVSLFGMGINNFGQQGDGTTTTVKTPTQIGEFSNVTYIITGNSVYFIDSGKLYGMGYNGTGQMGDGTTTNVTTPKQIGEFSNVTDVNGSNTVCFIDSGKLYGMGQNNKKQIANTETTDVTTPTQIGEFSNVTDVVTGSTTFFIDSGKLYAVGDNTYGQIGDGTTTNVTTPKQIGEFSNVTKIAGIGGSYIVFIDSGKLYGIGNNSKGQIGAGSATTVKTPTQIGEFSNVTDVVCSTNTTFFIDSGKLYGMGDNSKGQQGDGTTTTVKTPKQIGEFSNVTDVACSLNTTFFIDSGKLYGMGDNSKGQQGDGTTTTVKTPKQIGEFSNVTYVACSDNTTFFIDSGKLYGIGSNASGQQGDGTTTNVTTPKQVGWYSDLHYVSADSNATFFVMTKDNTPTHTYTFDANGGSVSPASATGSINSPITLPTPTKSGYTFVGWYAATSGLVKIGNAGDEIIPIADKTIYARWSPIEYTITFDANGGTITGATKLKGSADSPITLPTVSKTGSNLLGWYTAKTDGVLIGQPGNSYTPTASITAYAVWTDSTVYSYTVKYDANGGKGAPNLQSFVSASDITDKSFTISMKEPSKSYTTFLGWATTPTATEAEYSGGDEITVATDETVTLYAVWGDQDNPTYTLMSAIPLTAAIGVLAGLAVVLFRRP